MSRRRFTFEEIVAKLQEADAELAKGQTKSAVCRKIGVSAQSYYRWRKDFCSSRTEQVRRFKCLPQENGRLRAIVPEQAAENAILRAAVVDNQRTSEPRRGT